MSQKKQRFILLFVHICPKVLDKLPNTPAAAVTVNVIVIIPLVEPSELGFTADFPCSQEAHSLSQQQSAKASLRELHTPPKPSGGWPSCTI